MILQFLIKLFNKCLEECRIPGKMRNRYNHFIINKGNKIDLNDYRPISLLPQLQKLFTKNITIRLPQKLYYYQPVKQTGFSSGFSTMDHINYESHPLKKLPNIYSHKASHLQTERRPLITLKPGQWFRPFKMPVLVTITITS